jgi:dihydroxy-acid dehydratase
MATRSARALWNLAANGRTVRDIITRDSVRNAMAVHAACGGSTNLLLHVPAIAFAAGVERPTVDDWSEINRRVPRFVDVLPNGPTNYPTIRVFQAGGVPEIMLHLRDLGLLALDALTVTGQSLGELLASVTVTDDSVIRPVDNPLSTRPSIHIIRGSLLPGGGIVRLGGVGERRMTFSGPANIYHSRDEALEAISAGDVKPGQVLVLRGLGVVGGPGMALTSAVVFALDGAGLINDVAFITEGQLSGLVNEGLVVGEASPEAATGGPLALLENGDTITIDVTKKTVDLDVDAAVLAERRQHLQPFGAQNQTGWLGVYQRTVSPVHEGAVLNRK